MIFDSRKARPRRRKELNATLGSLYPIEPERIGIPRDVVELEGRAPRISDKQESARISYGTPKSPYELREVYSSLKDRRRRNLGTVSNPESLAKVVVDLAETWDDVEHFVVFHLSRQNDVMSYHVVGKGVIDAVMVHPREIFKTAIMQGVSSIIVVHNHPSGKTEPSEEDRRLTQRIASAGRVLDIKLLDHVIVATKDVDPPRFYSFAENENHHLFG